MHSLMNDYAAGLLGSHEPPCLSLYQPTHRHHPDNQQDPIRFRNLLKMEQSLRQKYTSRQAQPLLEPFQALADDNEFWNHTLDGLAALGAAGLFREKEHPSSGRPIFLRRSRTCSAMRFGAPG